MSLSSWFLSKIKPQDQRLDDAWEVNAICGFCGGTRGCGKTPETDAEFPTVSSQCAVCRKGSASFIGIEDFSDLSRKQFIMESCTRLNITSEELKHRVVTNAIRLKIGYCDSTGCNFKPYTYDEYANKDWRR